MKLPHSASLLRGCALLLPLWLAACATTPQEGSTLPSVEPQASIGIPSAEANTTPGTPVLLPNLPALPAPTPQFPPPAVAAPQLDRAAIQALLPAAIPERAGWATDIHNAFTALQLPATRENLCAAMAVIEQESSWRADPSVPGLGRMVWQQMYAKAARYNLPQFAVNLAMRKRSPDGRSYAERIDALRTERELNLLYEDMVAELPDVAKALGGENPIRTGGPMQVSVAFAEALVTQRRYPYSKRGSVRHEVFTRHGGTYFGIAMLLDFAVAYSRPLYRFADYNAGRYSSRNAAFQLALARLSGKPLVLDGDLLRYRDGRPLREASASVLALKALGPRLGLDEASLWQDLQREKHASFTATALWQRVFALAEAQAGAALAREAMPQIRLQSPKITRKLTTEWFAQRVEGRYLACLKR